MDLLTLTEAAWGVLDELAPHTTALPKLKKAIDGKFGYDPDNSVVGTKAGRPSAINKGGGSGGDKTGAGIKPKSVASDGDKTGAGIKPKSVTKKPAAKGPSLKPTSCPGGGSPRMVFGKWRCTGAPSKGATKAKSRIATKRKAKTKPPKKGLLAKLVHKARAAFAGMFD